MTSHRRRILRSEENNGAMHLPRTDRPTFDPSPFPDAERTPQTEEALWRGLSGLSARGHEVVVVQVLHPDEIEFPWTDDRMLRFEDLRQIHDTLESPGQRLRAAYLDKFAAHLETIADDCERAGLRLLRTRTDEAAAAAFVRLLGLLAGSAPAETVEVRP